MSSFGGAHFYTPLETTYLLHSGFVVFLKATKCGKEKKMENIEFYLNKALFISEEYGAGEIVYQYVLVPQEHLALNKKGNVGKDAYYKAFCLKNGKLDTDFGIKKIRWHYDLNNLVQDASWTKFVPIGYGQLLLDEAEAKIKSIKFLKVKKLNELLDEALDAPAV